MRRLTCPDTPPCRRTAQHGTARHSTEHGRESAHRCCEQHPPFDLPRHTTLQSHIAQHGTARHGTAEHRVKVSSPQHITAHHSIWVLLSAQHTAEGQHTDVASSMRHFTGPDTPHCRGTQHSTAWHSTEHGRESAHRCCQQHAPFYWP